MSMRTYNKSTAWKYDGRNGKSLSKDYSNTLERREAEELINDYFMVSILH